jgi:hypothetical protein
MLPGVHPYTFELPYPNPGMVPGVHPFNFEPPPINTGILMNPTVPPLYPGPTVIHHHHHPSPVPSYTSSITPSTNNITAHVPGGTISGQYNRTNDSTDCCILI